MSHVRSLITSRLASQTLQMFGMGQPCIFMLHRIEAEGETRGRHALADLQQLLEWIRRQRFRVVDAATLIEECAAGRGGGAAVAFTIDDGYHDQADVAIPLFLRYDMPVTTFLLTGFLDGINWLWHDQIAYILCATQRTSVTLAGSDGPHTFHWTDRESRLAAADAMTGLCKSDPAVSGRTVIPWLAAELEVSVPHAPPHEFRPMRWDDARALEARGARFGAHTVSHAVLSHLDDSAAQAELQVSRARLQAELADPSPVFCYPFGQADHVRTIHMEQAQRTGYGSAVLASPGYVRSDDLQRTPLARYAVPRFALERNPFRNMQIVNGFEHFRDVTARR